MRFDCEKSYTVNLRAEKVSKGRKEGNGERAYCSSI